MSELFVPNCKPYWFIIPVMVDIARRCLHGEIYGLFEAQKDG